MDELIFMKFHKFGNFMIHMLTVLFNDFMTRTNFMHLCNINMMKESPFS